MPALWYSKDEYFGRDADTKSFHSVSVGQSVSLSWNPFSSEHCRRHQVFWWLGIQQNGTASCSVRLTLDLMVPQHRTQDEKLGCRKKCTHLVSSDSTWHFILFCVIKLNVFTFQIRTTNPLWHWNFFYTFSGRGNWYPRLFSHPFPGTPTLQLSPPSAV